MSYLTILYAPQGSVCVAPFLELIMNTLEEIFAANPNFGENAIPIFRDEEKIAACLKCAGASFE
jgi:hypothetical protein